MQLGVSHVKVAYSIPFSRSNIYLLHACMLSHSVVSDSETPGTAACVAPPSMGFSRQEYWDGLPFPPPRDLPDPGIKPGSLAALALAGGFFYHCTTWKAPSAGCQLKLDPVLGLEVREQDAVLQWRRAKARAPSTGQRSCQPSRDKGMRNYPGL